MVDESKLPVLLESGDLAREARISSSYVRKLTNKGVVAPVAITHRRVRLFEPSAVNVLRKWLRGEREP